MTEIYLLFFHAVLPCFNNFNRLLQQEEPLIYKLHEAQQRFLHKLASKFVKPSVIQVHKTAGLSFADLDVSLESQRDDVELGIGITTRATVMKLLKTGDVDSKKVDKFFDATRAFFATAYKYCVHWSPLDDEFLKACIFVDFGKRNDVSFRDIETTIHSFTHINRHIINDPSMLDVVEEQFLDFQAMADTDIPANVWEESLVQETKRETFYRMDIIWGYLKSKVPLLCEIALSVLVIPDSNAAEERVFSIIRKNKTEFRSRLAMKGSLNSIMRIKTSMPESLISCHSWNPPDELLKECKSAVKKYNEAHRKL